jgi:hypothetical protein
LGVGVQAMTRDKKDGVPGRMGAGLAQTSRATRLDCHSCCMPALSFLHVYVSVLSLLYGIDADFKTFCNHRKVLECFCLAEDGNCRGMV